MATVQFHPPPGYLDLVFTRNDATTFIRDLLRRDAHACRVSIDCIAGSLTSISVAAADFPHVRCNAIGRDGAPRVVLDYVVPPESRGRVVPMRRFVAYQGTARRETELSRLKLMPSPMFLLRVDGALGLPVDYVLTRGVEGALWCGSEHPMDGQSSVKMRIHWPGYEAYCGQIQLRSGQNKMPITFSTLVRLAAKRIESFLLSAVPSDDGSDARWQISGGYPNRPRVTSANLVLIGLVAVCPGSIMPIIEVK